MDRDLRRTCSARQALDLATADGCLARVGSTAVRIRRPTGREPIDPWSHARYIARIEVLTEGSLAGEPAEPRATEVVAELFGLYLD